jgi:hypothetical protein
MVDSKIVAVINDPTWGSKKCPCGYSYWGHFNVPERLELVEKCCERSDCECDPSFIFDMAAAEARKRVTIVDEDKIETKELARLMTNALKAMPDCASCNLPIWDKHVWPQGGLPRFAYLGAHRPLGCTAQVSYLELARCKAMRKLKNKEDEAWKACEEFENLAPEGIDFATWDLSFTYKASRCKFHGVRFGRLIRGFEVEGMKVCCTELRGLACGSPRFFINETRVYHGNESLSTQFIKWRKIQQSSRRKGDTLDQDRPCIYLMGDTFRPQGWTTEEWDKTLWRVWNCRSHGYTFATFEADPCCDLRHSMNKAGRPPADVIAVSPTIRDAFKEFLTKNYVYPEKDGFGTVETPLVKEADLALEHILDEDDPKSPHKGKIGECVECARLEHDKGHKESNWRVCPTCDFANTQEVLAGEHAATGHGTPVAACPRCYPGQEIQRPELLRLIMEEEHANGGHAISDARCPRCTNPRKHPDPELERLLTEEEHIEGQHDRAPRPLTCSLCKQLKLVEDEKKKQQPMVTAGVLTREVTQFSPVESSELDAVKQELLDNINGNATMAQDVLTSLGDTQSAHSQQLAALETATKAIMKGLSQLGDSIRIIQIGLENDREKARIANMTAPKFKAYDLVTTTAGPWLGMKLSVVERRSEGSVGENQTYRYFVENTETALKSWCSEDALIPWVETDTKFRIGDRVARAHRPEIECEVLEIRGVSGDLDYRVRALGRGISAWVPEAQLLPWTDALAYKYNVGDFLRSWYEYPTEHRLDAERRTNGRFALGDMVCPTIANAYWNGQSCTVIGRTRVTKGDEVETKYQLKHPVSKTTAWFFEEGCDLVARGSGPLSQAKQTTTGDPQVTEVKKETPIVFNTYFCTAFNTQSGKIYEEGKVVSAKTRDGAKLKIAVKLDLPAKVDIEDVTITAVAQSPN